MARKRRIFFSVTLAFGCSGTHVRESGPFGFAQGRLRAPGFEVARKKADPFATLRDDNCEGGALRFVAAGEAEDGGPLAVVLALPDDLAVEERRGLCG